MTPLPLGGEYVLRNFIFVQYHLSLFATVGTLRKNCIIEARTIVLATSSPVTVGPSNS